MTSLSGEETVRKVLESGEKSGRLLRKSEDGRQLVDIKMARTRKAPGSQGFAGSFGRLLVDLLLETQLRTRRYHFLLVSKIGVWKAATFRAIRGEDER